MIKTLCKKAMLLMAVLTLQVAGHAANEKTTVSQVTTAVTVSGNVDYVISNSQPFDGNGSIDITNTEHAVVVFERTKPSTVLTFLSNRVRINGQAAVSEENCQVRLYGTKGSMVIPYASSDKPLTVYAGQNFEGQSTSDFGMGNDGGYMNTLTEQQLNNSIRSFRLKRGYMVTFSTRPGGRGYSRCFIANNEDLEMATLPAVLDQKISSYRIFRWNTLGKAALASSTDMNAVKALGVISCYGWSTGWNMYPDCECVPHHIYEDYPTSADCGKVTWSCHLKTNNEPLNTADDKPQSLETILNNWENLMRTGLRLCSPSSWDGSPNFLKQFFDSIDARGWRCDLTDMHCYWEEDGFNNLQGYYNSYKRPIWISEWIWGASWNNNGAFASGVTDTQIKAAVQNICTKLNSWNYIERYYYWNSESKAKLYNNGSLTAAGQWYSEQLTGMGYKENIQFVPTTPPQKRFSNYQENIADGRAVISWHDYNGEYNQLMEIQRKEQGGQWHTLQTITPVDGPSDYTVTDDNAPEGTRYRLHLVDLNGLEYYSSESLDAGDEIEVGGQQMFVGGNVIPNGQFLMGTYGWTSGARTALALPWFEVFPKSGSDSHFLQAFGNKSMDDAASVRTAFAIEPGQDYIFSMCSQKGGTYLKVSLTSDGWTEANNVITLKGSNDWVTQRFTFNSGNYSQALLAFRWLACTAALTDIQLCRLFTTREEAVSDGIAQQRARAETVKAWNTGLTMLNDELDSNLSQISSTGDEALAEAKAAVDNVLKAIACKQTIDSLTLAAEAVVDMNFGGREDLQQALQQATRCTTAADYINTCRQLQQALDNFLPMTAAESQPQSPDFSAETGWEVKVGTVTGGDQRLATHENLTCWNAWWSGIDAAKGLSQTLEIRQHVKDLPEGLYSLQCKASTQHACLSDQHGYIVLGNDTLLTPQLQRDYLDIPGTPTAWQTLTTAPFYVAEGGTVTIGFASSKVGATDYAWHQYNNSSSNGDRREGWWCATDFTLLWHPLTKVSVTPQQWGAVCLPYAYRQPADVKLYQVAGLLSDYSRICLEEVAEAEAGYPYIYLPSTEQIVYFTYGEAASRPVTMGTNNLRGYFYNAGSAPTGSYVLGDDGEWHRVTADNRPRTGSYTALISKAEGMPIIDEWDGPTMVIHNVTDELGTPTAISSRQTAGEAPAATPQQYNLGGQPITQPKGIRIEVTEGKARKVASK